MTHNNTQRSAADRAMRGADERVIYLWTNRWEGKKHSCNGRAITVIQSNHSLVAFCAVSIWDKWTGRDTSLFMESGEHDRRTAEHSPDNVHVCVSVTNVQAQQWSDVIRWCGWTHIPSDDVHPVGKNEGLNVYTVYSKTKQKNKTQLTSSLF